MLLISFAVSGQQLPLFTQYVEYGGLNNPAHLSLRDLANDYNQSVGLSYRDQWNQIPDRPKTFAMRYDHFLPSVRGTQLQLGGYLVRDEVGVFSDTEFKARVASVFRLDEKKWTGFSVGLNVGVGLYQIDLSNLAYVELDPELFRGEAKSVSPDLGVGANYFKTFDNRNVLQIGLSIPQIFGLDRTYTNEDKTYNLEKVPHYYLTSNYYHYFNDETFFEFSGWLKRVQNVPLNYDVNAKYHFTQQFWLGAGVNNGGIIHTEFGVKYKIDDSKQIRASYSYNPTFHTHSILFGNIHEINISYLIR